MVYSIFTGVPGKTLRSIMPFFSISRSLAESVFGFIPSIESRNSLNLLWSSCVMLRKMCTVNFFPIILNVLSIGQAFMLSSNTLHSSSFNLPYPHLISLLSVSNLYTYLCIVSIENRGEKKIENTQNKEIHVKEISSSQWEDEIVKSKIPLFVDFWAPWCGPCRAVAPIVEEIASEYSGRLSFVKVNVDQNKELASKYNVFSIPTLAVISEGNLISQQVGVSTNAKASLKNMIENALKKL